MNDFLQDMEFGLGLTVAWFIVGYIAASIPNLLFGKFARPSFFNRPLVVAQLLAMAFLALWGIGDIAGSINDWANGTNQGIIVGHPIDPLAALTAGIIQISVLLIWLYSAVRSHFWV